MASSPKDSPPNSSPPSPLTTSPPPPQPNSSPPPPPLPTSPPPLPTSPPPPQPNSSLPPSPLTTSPPPPQPNSSPPPQPLPTSPPPPQPDSSPPPPPTKDDTTPPTPPADRGNDSGSGNDNASPPPPPPPYMSPSHASPHYAPQLAPPLPGKSSPSSNSDSISMPLRTAIGAAIGVGALFIVVMVLMVVMCSKKKKKPKRPDDQMPYYIDPPQGGPGYYKGTPAGGQNIWQDSPREEHAINILPLPPGAIGSGTPVRGGWQPSPSPLGAIGSATPGNGGSPSPPGPIQVPVNGSDVMSSSNSNLSPHAPVLPPSHRAVALGFNQYSFSYEELVAATNGFAQSNLLGQGGFGYVHKGVLPNGREIAVKSLKSGSGQGDREFQAEVEIIGRVHHRYLVALVGFCMAGNRRMLVYEFIPNKTLKFHLHEKGRHPMDWATRLKIALGAAKGLAYLREDCHPRIIHRDIKSANILIDYSFEAKVADFGLAKLTQDNNTHVSTRVMGTFGYLAPEYASSGKLTEKSDVFSFGVVLLEIITGRRPLDMSGDHLDENLVDWARPLCSRAIEQGNYNQLADPFLQNNYVPHEMACMVQCAAAAIRHSARRRPKMRQIVCALEDNVSLDDLNDMARTEEGSNFSLSGSADDEARLYSADIRKFRKMALDSQVQSSSDAGNTSEYGLNPSSSSFSSSSGSKGEAGVNTSRPQSP